jgi:hypothetical protein
MEGDEGDEGDEGEGSESSLCNENIALDVISLPFSVANCCK